MKVFWSSCGHGVSGDDPHEVTAEEASLIWTDEVRGVQGSFLGLVDDLGRTIQFYWEGEIPEETPNYVDSTQFPKVILVDIPVPKDRGSYQFRIQPGLVGGLMNRVFEGGADPDLFEERVFCSWDTAPADAADTHGVEPE